MANRDQAIQARIEDIQKELTLLEVPYARALKRANGEDEEWNARKGTIENRIFNLVKTFKIGDNGEKAIAIVAQCAILAHELTAAEGIIAQYREKKWQLEAAQRERMDDSGV